MKTLLFVYGTLKKGCRNHRQLAGQAFIGPARTVPGFRLFDLGGYPGIVATTGDQAGVVGEVWEVEAGCLSRLDRFEGVHEGLYRREPIPLKPPFANQTIDAYVSALTVVGCRDVGSEWIETGLPA